MEMLLLRMESIIIAVTPSFVCEEAKCCVLQPTFKSQEVDCFMVRLLEKRAKFAHSAISLFPHSLRR